MQAELAASSWLTIRHSAYFQLPAGFAFAYLRALSPPPQSHRQPFTDFRRCHFGTPRLTFHAPHAATTPEVPASRRTFEFASSHAALSRRRHMLKPRSCQSTGRRFRREYCDERRQPAIVIFTHFADAHFEPPRRSRFISPSAISVLPVNADHGVDVDFGQIIRHAEIISRQFHSRRLSEAHDCGRQRILSVSFFTQCAGSPLQSRMALSALEAICACASPLIIDNAHLAEMAHHWPELPTPCDHRQASPVRRYQARVPATATMYASRGSSPTASALKSLISGLFSKLTRASFAIRRLSPIYDAIFAIIARRYWMIGLRIGWLFLMAAMTTYLPHEPFFDVSAARATDRCRTIVIRNSAQNRFISSISTAGPRSLTTHGRTSQRFQRYRQVQAAAAGSGRRRQGVAAGEQDKSAAAWQRMVRRRKEAVYAAVRA